MRKKLSSSEKSKNRQESEKERFASFPKLNPNPVLELDSFGKITFANKAALQVSKKAGREAADFLPGDAEKILKFLRKKQQKKFYREINFGERIFAENIYLAPQFNAVRVFAVDITSRKNAEVKLKKINAGINEELDEKVRKKTGELMGINRALAMLTACNRALIYSQNEEKLLNEICRIIVEVGGYRWAWVGNAEKNERKNVRAAAQMGLESDYLEKANITWSERDIRGRGPIGIAIRTGKIIVGKNFYKDTNLAPWKGEAIKRGFGSMIALPLKNREGTFGVLVIYAREPRAFHKKEIKLLYELAEDLAFGINTLRDREHHAEMEEMIIASNELLGLSNQSSSKQEYLDSAVQYIKKWSGCAFLGIRILQKEEFIPYESYTGFSRDFWQSENMLSLKKDQCACIRVIAGKPDPQDRSAMTETGSFYTNDSAEFIAGLTDKEQARFRGKCIRCGFDSIAIIPIRRRETVLGAIHIADKKPGMLPFKKIRTLETLAVLIGEAVNKFNAQERLRHSEKKYRELVENANSIIMRLDSSGDITYFNEFAQKFFDFKEKEIIGKNVVGTIVPETDSEGRDLRAMVKEVFKNPNQFLKNENENTRRNGERVWVSWNNKPEFGRDGKINGFLCIGMDITERKKREEQLVESYEYLGAINRKIPLLLELDRHAKGGKKKEITEYVINSAVNISRARVGLLYRYDEDRKFYLLSASGISRNRSKEIKIIQEERCVAIRSLLKKHDRTQGISQELATRCFKGGDELSYPLLLPLKRRTNDNPKGFILLGFADRESMDTQELEFFDLFSMHASAALLGAEIIK